MNSYQANSIKTLDPIEHIRKYPGMYISSKDAAGLLHCTKELLNNSIDEFLNGAGDRIIIRSIGKNGLSIEDNGRGIPHGTHENGWPLVAACLGLPNTGGKFDNTSGETGYNTSGGQHGVGSSAVNAVSRKFIAKTRRDGIEEKVVFEKGKYINCTEKTISKSKTGLYIEFYPDPEVMEATEFDITAIKKLVRELSFLCKGLHFEVDGEEYYSANGLSDYLQYLNKDGSFITKPFYFVKSEGKFKIEAAIGYNQTYSSSIKLYTNNVPQSSGTHLTGFKTAWTSGLNKFARDKKLLKEKDSNLMGSDYEEGLNLVLNFYMIDPVFKGQAKEELSSSEGRTYCQKFTTQAIEDLIKNNEKDLKIIVSKAIEAKKSREAAKKARDAVRQPKEKGLKAKLALSKKFTDCASKDPKKRNLLLVEGRSAGSSAVEARNPDYDCIYQLRGKPISPLKTSIEKILANQEMSDIIRVLGAGFDKDFNVKKMNFNKVVIVSDADADGEAIELLLTTFFFTYMRPLIETGKLYRAVTPLYIVRKGKEEEYFYTEEEMDDWRKLNKTGWDIIRAKGLGELNAKDLQNICFKNERYKRITISDIEKSKELLEVLEGKAVEPRKKYVYENATALGFNFD